MLGLSAESEALIALAVGAATLIAAYMFSRIAVATKLLPDYPNKRSNHTAPTPRSGGGAIFIAWAGGMIAASLFLGGGAMTAGLVLIAGGVFAFGLVDDRFELGALTKLGAQIAAGVTFVLVFGPLETAPLPFAGETALGVWATPLTVFWIVAFMNAYNFMDGVNGVAAGCGALAFLALSLAAISAGAPFWALAALFGALALCGFLPVNFPSGRLFMGDSGSQSVGFLIAAIAVGAANASGGAVSALYAPALMAPFIVDVAFTLAHRLLRGKKIAAAHREHIYQLLVRMGVRQSSVTAVFLALTAFSGAGAIMMLRMAGRDQWLVPAALVSALGALAFLLVYRRALRMGLLQTAEPLRPHGLRAAEATVEKSESAPEELSRPTPQVAE